MHEEVERAQEGDLKAFERLVERFQDAVYGTVYALVGDFHDAQDLAQESFIRAWRRLGALHDPDRFPAWLYRITRNCCLDVLRRKGAVAEPLNEVNAPASSTPAPPEKLERAEMRQAVLDAIRSLSEPNRLATTLFYINGYSVQQVADFLDVPAGTVKRRLHDSRRQLKKRMEAMVEEELRAGKPGPDFAERVRQAIALQEDKRFGEAVSAHHAAVHVARHGKAEAQEVYDSYGRLHESYAGAGKLEDYAEGILHLSTAPPGGGMEWSRELNYAANMFVDAGKPERALALVPRMRELAGQMPDSPQQRCYLVEVLSVELQAAGALKQVEEAQRCKQDMLDALAAYEDEVRARYPSLTSARDAGEGDAKAWFTWLGHAHHNAAVRAFWRYLGDEATTLRLLRRASELRDCDATEFVIARLTLSTEHDRAEALRRTRRAFEMCDSEGRREYLRKEFATQPEFESVREDPDFLAAMAA